LKSLGDKSVDDSKGGASKTMVDLPIVRLLLRIFGPPLGDVGPRSQTPAAEHFPVNKLAEALFGQVSKHPMSEAAWYHLQGGGAAPDLQGAFLDL
jgi:hypothetical protein